MAKKDSWITRYKRKWYHNSIGDKIEEWLLWAGLALVAAGIAFVLFGR